MSNHLSMRSAQGSSPRRLSLHIALCGLLLPFSSAHAEIDDTSLLLQLSGDEELISIATGTPRPISKAPAVASVITAADIKASGANTVQEALEQVPGLHVGLGTQQNRVVYSIRGIHTSLNPQVLILFNNTPITDLFNGSHATKLVMPVENIQRIEVIRGPGSAVYGADAFAGVINIITKDEKDIDGSQAGIRVGSFDTQAIYGQYGGVHNGWRVAASVEYDHTNGDRSRRIDSDLQSVFDGIFSTTASQAPGALDTRYESLVTGLTVGKGNWQLRFNGWNQHDIGNGAGVANALDPDGHHEIEQYLVDLGYKNSNFAPNWSLETNLSYRYMKTEDNFTIFPAGTVLPIGSDGNLDFVTPAGLVAFTDGLFGNPDGRHEATQFTMTGFYSGFKDHLTRISAGARYEELRTAESKNFGTGVIDGTVSPINGTLTDVTGTASVFNPGGDRTVSFLSLQDEWHFAADWVLTAGVRYDDYSDFGSTTNPRLSLVWNARQDLTAKLLYGSAFRAPSFNEQLVTSNPIGLGNPNLAPEEIDTLELAFDYHPTTTVTTSLNLFKYKIKGLIEYIDDDGLPGGTSTTQNARDQKASGFELGARWQASPQLRLSGNYAFQNAVDDTSGAKIADAPRKQLHLSANWRFMPKWSAQLDAFRIMDRPRPVGDARDEVDDFTWVNLTVNGKDVVKGVDAKLAVRNLFDTDAREPAPAEIPNDYPLEGRSLYLSISSRF